MRLVSFRIATPLGPRTRLGAIADEGGRVVDIEIAHRLMLMDDGVAPKAAERISSALTPPDCVAFIEADPLSRAAAASALKWVQAAQPDAEAEGAMLLRDFESLSLLSPVPRPVVLRDFMAFETHLKNIFPKLGREIPEEWYNLPVYYKGNPGAVGAHGEDIPIPDYRQEAKFDFEFEFAVVIGKGGKNIPPERAMDHVYGYMLYNDFSERAIQAREMSVGLGPAKGKDFGHAHVFGPWLVTADEIEDIYGLPMKATVNGEVWADTHSGTLHYKIADMIAHASWNEEIYPGEVYGTGTAGMGSGAERDQFLKKGDVVELTMGPLGTLRNRVV